MERIGAVVLAGGRATRLGGVNKALLEVGGRRIIDRVVGTLRLVAERIVIVGHLSDGLDLPGTTVLADDYPGAGTLAALHKGILASECELCLAVGCDMPFLSRPLLARLVELSEGYDVAVPRIGPYLEALHAAYRATCLPVIEAAISRRQLKIIDFYMQVRTREVPEVELRRLDPELRSFLNVNTIDDLEKARALAEGPRGVD